MKQQIDYKQYLASREWRIKRKGVIERNNNICERCASRPIENVHHLSYENIGDEDPSSELMGVCRPCHEYLAAERDDDPALDIIQGVISKHGLFSFTPWPKTKEYPAFFGGEINGRQLWVFLVCTDYDCMMDFYPGAPKRLLDEKTMAIFTWCEPE